PPHVEALSGRLVDHHRADLGAALGGDENNEKKLALRPEPVAPPAPHGGEHVPEGAALVGEPILVARRPLGVRDLREEALVDEALEALREHRARDLERLLDVLEAPPAGERLAEDERRPPVADEVRRACDRTRPAMKPRPSHFNEGIAPLAPSGKARRGPRLSSEGIAPLAPSGKARRGPTPRGLASLASCVMFLGRDSRRSS